MQYLPPLFFKFSRKYNPILLQKDKLPLPGIPQNDFQRNCYGLEALWFDFLVSKDYYF